MAGVLLGLTSCNDDNDELTDSRLTYYADLQLQGDEFMLVPIGSNFSDITYSAVGSDGYPASVERTVCVYDPSVTTDMSGEYTVQEGSFRYWFATGAVVPFSGYPVTIERIVPSIFSISDMMGGYYDQRAGYGPRYMMGGYLQLTNDNEVIALSAIVPGWSDSYDEFYDGSYDPETHTVTFDLDYGGQMQFHIILN